MLAFLMEMMMKLMIAMLVFMMGPRKMTLSKMELIRIMRWMVCYVGLFDGTEEDDTEQDGTDQDHEMDGVVALYTPEQHEDIEMHENLEHGYEGTEVRVEEEAGGAEVEAARAGSNKERHEGLREDQRRSSEGSSQCGVTRVIQSQVPLSIVILSLTLSRSFSSLVALHGGSSLYLIKLSPLPPKSPSLLPFHFIQGKCERLRTTPISDPFSETPLQS
ncbi:hypothetical protein F2Q69_00041985 [Brassica cretica]|uniref:Uncharacterized protein n=1 Tax=Brassica cretica TaxID=69181 RepID=A0A8S9NEH5_BRACR|nr:hypothetical protein F2Q69_00041985 [Brassica cretica]